MKVTFAVKESFFDRPKVIKALGRAKRKALSKAGAFVRKRARSSLRRRKKPSAPGSPPSVHSKDNISLKTILFAFDPQAETTVVGPVALNQVNFTLASVTTTVPGLHERGETAVIREYRHISERNSSGENVPWRRVNGRRKPRQYSGFKLEIRSRTARYPKRPFMGPALEAEAPNFPELFANSIK